MKRESVLEFMLEDELFCFNTRIVEFVFELETYETLSGVSPYILGIAKHDNEAILLVDTLHLYDAQKNLNKNTPKSVIVIKDEHGATYGMVVDTIVHIEELEVAPVSLDLNSEDLVINHYKQQDKIVNEIVPLPLLKSHHIPSFDKSLPHNQNDEQSNASKEYMLFKVGTKLYALNTDVVEEVVEKETDIFKLEKEQERFQGAIAVRERVIRIAKLNQYQDNADDLIVVEKKGNRFALLASQILGIESFALDKIEYLESHSNISGFYNLNSEVVAIVNVDYFLSNTKQEEKSVTKTSVETDKNLEYLLFEIGGKDFAINMKHIRQVVQTEDIAKTKSSAIGVSDTIEFIAQWNHRAIDIMKLDTKLGVNTQDNAEIIMLEFEDKISGILVDEIDDICYINSKNVVNTQEHNSLIDGALIQDNRVIPTLNPKQILQVA